MSVIDEVIRIEEDNSLSFGNYSVSEKQKVNDFEAFGDVYKVKTHNEITRLEKNGKLLLETVPGATVHNLKVSEKGITFLAEGVDDTQITLELESGVSYKIYVDDVNIGKMKANLSGKINFSVELGTTAKAVHIDKK
ncbi:MAG: endosialidase [Clostridiales bacterium]|jgi:hypothetical protein|nr:endosialidase [Clostridiales bacterium]